MHATALPMRICGVILDIVIIVEVAAAAACVAAATTTTIDTVNDYLRLISHIGSHFHAGTAAVLSLHSGSAG